MLSQAEVIVFAAAVIIVLPIAIASLMGGSKLSGGGFMAKYHAASRHLSFVGDLFLLAVCASGLVRLAAHFNVISAETFAWLAFVVGIPFGVLLVLFLALWVRAIVAVRRQQSAAS